MIQILQHDQNTDTATVVPVLTTTSPTRTDQIFDGGTHLPNLNLDYQDNAVEKVAFLQAVFDVGGQNWIPSLQHNQNTKTTAVVPVQNPRKAVFDGGGQNAKKLKKRTKITISLKRTKIITSLIRIMNTIEPKILHKLSF